MKFSKFFLAAFAGSLLFVSCSDDDNLTPIELPLGSYDNGVLVLNQGGFGHGDASMSYISNDLSVYQDDIFSVVNPDLELGDTAQDVAFYNEFAYIILNVSNKIEIVNRYTMKSVGTIETGLNNPRYMAVVNGKGYVTNWGDAVVTTDDYVAVINLSSNTITSSIPVIEGPERIIENNGKLYVAQTGGYGYGNKITVINPSSNTVATTITVGDVPNGMQVKDGNLWVSCGGKPSYAPTETAGSLVKINLANNTVTATLAFPAITQHPSNLVIDGDNAFYTVDSGVYKMALNASEVPSAPAFTTTSQGVYGVYSFAIKSNRIFVGDAGDYNSAGKVYVYSQGNSGETIGELKESFTVGVVPAGFYFN